VQPPDPHPHRFLPPISPPPHSHLMSRTPAGSTPDEHLHRRPSFLLAAPPPAVLPPGRAPAGSTRRSSFSPRRRSLPPRCPSSLPRRRSLPPRRPSSPPPHPEKAGHDASHDLVQRAWKSEIGLWRRLEVGFDFPATRRRLACGGASEGGGPACFLPPVTAIPAGDGYSRRRRRRISQGQDCFFIFNAGTRLQFCFVFRVVCVRKLELFAILSAKEGLVCKKLDLTHI
jgi:hypothetical protein